MYQIIPYNNETIITKNFEVEPRIGFKDMRELRELR